MRDQPNPHPRPSVAIVGAGASGVLLAGALVSAGVAFDVALVDPRPGRGVAYGGADPEHLLNTRAGNMSLDAYNPSNFHDWLRTYRPRPEGWTEEDFAPRRIYGDYLEHYLRDLQDRTPGLGSTRVVASTAQSAERTEDGWAVRLGSGEQLQADTLVLATGWARPRPLIFHGRDEIDAFVHDDPWDDLALKALPEQGTVLLVGAGPTAADVAGAIWRKDPERKVVIAARHGLLPRVHASPPPRAPVIGKPYPTTARELYTKLRAAAEFVEGDNALRHGVFLNLREIAADLWAALPFEERQMFLRHFRPYWEVERHRIPPAVAAPLERAIADGRLEIVRGRLAEGKALKSGLGARVALLAHDGPRALDVGLIINCTGPETDPFRSRNPLLLDLLAQGAAAADPLGLGLHVDADSAVLNAHGDVEPDLYALGPPTQGRFFEITAVAEIREMAGRIAQVIAGKARPLAEGARPRLSLAGESHAGA